MPNRQADWSTPLDSGGGGCPPAPGMDGMVGADFLDRLAATDRFHGDPGPELGTVGAALAQLLRRKLRLRRELLSGAVPRPQRLTMGAVQKSQTTSLLNLGRFESLIHDKDARNHPSVRQSSH